MESLHLLVDIFTLVATGVTWSLVARLRREEKERNEATNTLLTFIKEWAQMIKGVRDETEATTKRASDKLEKKTEEVKQAVKEVPVKVVEKLRETNTADEAMGLRTVPSPERPPAGG